MFGSVILKAVWLLVVRVAWSGGRSQSVTQTLSSTVGGCSGGGGFGAGGGGSDDGGNDDTLVGLSSSVRTLTANFATRECAALSLTPATNRQAPRPPRLASCAIRIAAMTFRTSGVTAATA